MSFIDTEPAAIDRQKAPEVWYPFRVGDPRLRRAMLLSLCSGDTPVTIGSSGGPKVTAALWSVEANDDAGRLHFSVASGVSELDAVAALRKPWAAAYLDDVKLQFELRSLVLECTGGRQILHAQIPSYMVRLPRRQSVRVRRSADDSPVARLPQMQGDGSLLPVRVLDISLDGCALLKPASTAPLAPGDALPGVTLELGEGIVIEADLRVQHVTPGPVGLHGWRVGCEWQALDEANATRLAQWITGGRWRRQLVSLGLN
ncbi:MAG: flagellar brake protein [Pseudomonadota bacterium]|nr:flagellar brake protein [Pseudomonadota bacterium]